MYGLHTLIDRKPLWSELQHHLESCNNEWLAIGDYNSVFEFGHRINGRSVTDAETVDGARWMDRCGLGFVKSLGHFFSWSKKGISDSRIYSRIDHCVANDKWLMKYSNTYVHYLNRSLSDHSPLVVKIQKKEDSGGRPFTVFDHLLAHSSFLGIVKEEWEKDIPKKGFQLIYVKLDSIKKRLKGLHSTEFCNVTGKIEHFQKQVDHIQRAMESRPLSQQLIDEEIVALKEWRHWLQVESSILK